MLQLQRGVSRLYFSKGPHADRFLLIWHIVEVGDGIRRFLYHRHTIETFWYLFNAILDTSLSFLPWGVCAGSALWCFFFTPLLLLYSFIFQVILNNGGSPSLHYEQRQTNGCLVHVPGLQIKSHSYTVCMNNQEKIHPRHSYSYYNSFIKTRMSNVLFMS